MGGVNLIKYSFFEPYYILFRISIKRTELKSSHSLLELPFLWKTCDSFHGFPLGFILSVQSYVLNMTRCFVGLP